MPKILEQQYDLSVAETEVVSINYSDVLDSGELLTGTPTVTEVSTANLSLANKLVSTATYTESFSGETVAIGKAVMGSTQMQGSRKGAAVQTERVLMEPGTYPKAWKSSNG